MLWSLQTQNAGSLGLGTNSLRFHIHHKQSRENNHIL